MNQLVPFNYEGKEIRTVIANNGETMWVAKDVAEVLGYKDTANAVKVHCKGVAKHHPLLTDGGIQKVRVIHEPDLYRMIAKSQLEGAERFEKWIFEEVLPTLRKTGRYETAKPQVSTLPALARDFRALKSMAITAGLKGNAAIISASQSVQRLTGQDPLAMIGETSLVSEAQERHFTPTDLGKKMGGVSPARFNKMLVENGLQISVTEGKDKYWQPTEAGKPHFVLIDSGKRHNGGQMIQAVRWFESVLSLLSSTAVPAVTAKPPFRGPSPVTSPTTN